MAFSRSASDTSFRILVMGDFGATAAPSRPLLIDRDNVDQVMKRLDVGVELPGAGRLRFHELEDFHPDRLFQALDQFHLMRELRTNLANPETFRATASELLEAAQAAPRPPEPDIHSMVAPGSGSLLDEIVEASSTGLAAAPARRNDPLHQYIKDVVAPYLVPRADLKQEELMADVDESISAQMRALLHERRFQQLEAGWRALDFLVRRADTGTNLKIYLLHVPKNALSADLLPATDLRQTAFYRVLVEETVGTPGAQPWALIAANYMFGPGAEDVELAGRIALLAAAAGAPMIARADPALLGDEDELAAFSELQSIPEARYIGLALPGFLLRLPYGKDTSPTELFPLEEMPGEPKHSDYLWGNPALVCALLMAEAFSDSGWNMKPGDVLDISGLPAHVYKKDGEPVLKPCAEVVMTESQATALMERGLIPLLSIKNSDRVHLAGFRSIAGTPLEGRWS